MWLVFFICFWGEARVWHGLWFLGSLTDNLRICLFYFVNAAKYLAGRSLGVSGGSLKVMVSEFGDNKKTLATSGRRGGACFIL